jgi:hypothetical protein
MSALKDRAEWLVGEYGAYTEIELRAVLRRFFDQWVEEFQIAELSLGVDS